jgi:hypothetical protein
MSKNINRILQLAMAVALIAATGVTASEYDGTVKLGGIAIDEQYGDLSSIQETYNIFDGFNLTQILLNARMSPKHYFTLNLREMNLDSRKGNFLYRMPGKVRFNSRYRQNRFVFDPDRMVTSERKRWGFDMSVRATKSMTVLANYDLNKRDGNRLSYPLGVTESWLGTGYNYTQHSGGLETQWVLGARSVALRYDFTKFSNRLDEQTNRLGHLLSARFSTPCKFYDKWTHFLRGAWGKHDVQNAGVDFTLLNFQYIGIIKPVQWFKFRYNLYLNSIDDSATGMRTDNVQNNFDADFYYKYGRVFGGYGIEINDDDRAITDYNTYLVGGTFDYEKLVHAKVSYANRAKTDKEKVTLLQDIETERFRADLKFTIDDLVIGGRYTDGQRDFPDIGARSKGQWTNAYLTYDLPVWFTIWGDYVYKDEDHLDLVGTFKTDSHILTSKLTFDRVNNLYLGFGATYLDIGQDLDIEKSILNFEGEYTIADVYHVEVKYNIYNYDDFMITNRYYTGNIVWFNFAYDFNVKS